LRVFPSFKKMRFPNEMIFLQQNDNSMQ
jgi:hypothetical protein